ncbi:peptidase inhibitor family I36 protein [Streptomyces sp. M19]
MSVSRPFSWPHTPPVISVGVNQWATPSTRVARSSRREARNPCVHASTSSSSPRPWPGRRPRDGTGGRGGAHAAHHPEASTAQQAPPGCPDEALCVYDRPDYRGRMKHLYGSNNNLRQYGGVFNRAMSVYNNSEYCVQYIYKETYRRGAPKIIPRQQGRNLGAPTRVWSNQREHCQA